MKTIYNMYTCACIEIDTVIETNNLIFFFSIMHEMVWEIGYLLCSVHIGEGCRMVGIHIMIVGVAI